MPIRRIDRKPCSNIPFPDREIEIIQSLLDRILVHAPAIALACDTNAELDCLLCFATASRTYQYVRPTMVEENVIDVKAGRHPLQELVVDLFVPNDVKMRGGEGLGAVTPLTTDGEDGEDVRPYSVLVLTGANACGKVIPMVICCYPWLTFVVERILKTGVSLAFSCIGLV